jgi:hypothetical protein
MPVITYSVGSQIFTSLLRAQQEARSLSKEVGFRVEVYAQAPYLYPVHVSSYHEGKRTEQHYDQWHNLRNRAYNDARDF